MTLKLGSGGAGGAWYGRPRIGGTHLYIICFTGLLPLIIKIFMRTSARVSLTPLCWTRACACLTTKRVTEQSKIKGCLVAKGISAFGSLPPHLLNSFSSRNIPNCLPCREPSVLLQMFLAILHQLPFRTTNVLYGEIGRCGSLP